MSIWISLYLTDCNTFAPPPGMHQWGYLTFEINYSLIARCDCWRTYGDIWIQTCVPLLRAISGQWRQKWNILLWKLQAWMIDMNWKSYMSKTRTIHHLQLKQPFLITYSVVNPPALPPWIVSFSRSTSPCSTRNNAAAQQSSTSTTPQFLFKRFLYSLPNPVDPP